MTKTKLLQMVLIATTVATLAAPAFADPRHDRDRDRFRHDRRRPAVVYDPGYVYAPPPVVYAPPPPPPIYAGPSFNLTIPLR